MNLRLHPVQLPLEYPFTIARGTTTTQSSLFVELEHEGLSGWGEVTANEYYGNDLMALIHAYQLFGNYLADSKVKLIEPEELMKLNEPIEPMMTPISSRISGYYHPSASSMGWLHRLNEFEGNYYALSALDIASHDLFGKQHGSPTWKQLVEQWPGDAVRSSYTIGIDSTERMLEKLAANPGWSVYKIKLGGTDQDLELVRQLRANTDAILRVDANESWNVEQAIRLSQQLADLGVELIEQPLPTSASRRDKLRLKQASALPIIADEDCQIESDLGRCAELYHGINVKLCKCGGLTPAARMLTKARKLGLKTMVGCMVESSVGISAAAQLLPLLDFADLDGALLLRDEPVHGIVSTGGHVELPTRPGNGAQVDLDRLSEFKWKPKT